MALVFLALNGVGLGHLVRTTAICRVLETVGERPVIFSQGIFPLDDRARFPGKRVPSLWKAEEPVRRRVSLDLRSLAEISLPAILVEDTHPNPIKLPRGVRRVLIVRPTTFPYLSLLNEQYGAIYSAFLLCDGPDSPTWPYSREETDTINGWPKWHIVGPIYRAAEAADVLNVRERYGVRPGQRLCVFSMGGGGQHHATDPDAAQFVECAARVADIARAADGHARLIFVQGPYFPSDIRIDSRFEVVAQEPQLPALLAAADGAVIRLGFNTTWECLAAGTPFWPFLGTTYAEPTEERLARLRGRGLVTDDIETFWNDTRWRDHYTRSCRSVIARWHGEPDAIPLRQLIVDEPRHRGRDAGIPRRERPPATWSRRIYAAAARTWYGQDRPLIIRIDDVVSFDSTLDWLLGLLALRRLRASLEVVPYLTNLDPKVLDRFDPERMLLEVSQHGYAHVPRYGANNRRHEFAPDSPAPSLDEERDIRWGKSHLERSFGSRFTGGFSAPYDALPRWLPSIWGDGGGLFVSCLSTNQFDGAPIPVVRAGTDIWDWGRDHSRARGPLVRDIERQARVDGHAGIVLHPRCLRSRLERGRLVALLDLLQDRGFVTVSLQGLALPGRVGAGAAPEPSARVR